MTSVLLSFTAKMTKYRCFFQTLQPWSTSIFTSEAFPALMTSRWWVASHIQHNNNNSMVRLKKHWPNPGIFLFILNRIIFHMYSMWLNNFCNLHIQHNNNNSNKMKGQLNTNVLEQGSQVAGFDPSTLTYTHAILSQQMSLLVVSTTFCLT